MPTPAEQLSRPPRHGHTTSTASGPCPPSTRCAQRRRTARRRLARLDGVRLRGGAALAFAALILYVLIGAELVGGGDLAQAGVGAATFILAARGGQGARLMRARDAGTAC